MFYEEVSSEVLEASDNILELLSFFAYCLQHPSAT
jgi:hypothetical protein